MTRPVIPWMGGKRRLVKHILPLLGPHVCYCEPFVGGGAVFFYKAHSQAEVINDLHSDLVTLYRVLKYHLDEFVRHFRWALVSREEFLHQQRQDPALLTDIQRAARFFYLQKLAYGGKTTGQTFGTSATAKPRMNLMRIEEELSEAHIRLSKAVIERLDWDECVERYDRPQTVFYLDPPYWRTTGYGVPFGPDQYERMAELARTVKGRMVISVGDHTLMREVFAGLPFRELTIQYTVGGGGRSQTAKELLIWNRDP